MLKISISLNIFEEVINPAPCSNFVKDPKTPDLSLDNLICYYYQQFTKKSKNRYIILPCQEKMYCFKIPALFCHSREVSYPHQGPGWTPDEYIPPISPYPGGRLSSSVSGVNTQMNISLQYPHIREVGYPLQCPGWTPDEYIPPISSYPFLPKPDQIQSVRG